jgi:gamma-glutamyltranspeptidase/glutathione hydrolase
MRRLLIAVLTIALLIQPLSAASKDPIRTRTGMVSSVTSIASRVGVEVMQKGGNAVDAAIAVSFALAVAWPRAGNIGGGGFMLIRMNDGSTEVIDYREVAPAAAKRTMYLDENGELVDEASTVGALAVGIPGTVAGLALAHERRGTLPWAELLAPAILLAEEGFVVNQSYEDKLVDEDAAKVLPKFEESRRIFLRDGAPYAAGERFIQPDLARTLKRIAEDPRDFYEGRTADLIAAEMARHGGLINADDLASYEAVVREPLRGTYRGNEVLTAPPPSSGGVALIGMLNVLEQTRVGEKEPGSAEAIHSLSEVMKRAFADRNEYLGDPAFVEIPLEGLISKAYASEVLEKIDFDKSTLAEEVMPGLPMLFQESDETTHFSIVDGQGNAVSNTTTLNGAFGSGVTVTGAGFLLNNEMDDFTTKPGSPNLYELIQGEANVIQPGKRPLSSMTPTIVVRDGRFWFAVGASGGPRIITTVLQVILNVVDHGMDLQEALDMPRVHHQLLPDHLYWERHGLNVDTRRLLEERGHEFRETPKQLGEAYGVMVDPETGVRYGACDSRGGGYPAGY